MSMTRQDLYNGIESRLSWLVSTIELRGKLNTLDLNIISEDFFAHFLNCIYDWNLHNINTAEHNAAALDLVDDNCKIIVQVSSTISKQKINSSLSKIDTKKYNGYSYKFIGITNDAKKLREDTYIVPDSIVFNPMTDIFDVASLLKQINSKSIEKITEICNFIQNEIKIPLTQEKFETHLAKIIEIISQTNLEESFKPETIPFNIDKKIDFNRLEKSKAIIDNYKHYYSTIDRIYTEFDKIGNNKSLSVLNKLKSIYIEKSTINNADMCFQQIIDDVVDFIKQSSNYTPLPEEELLMYVEIIVVDAFIRCKIFKNPEVIENVVAG